MPTVTVIVGLAGSGKSTRADELVDQAKAAGKALVKIDEQLWSRKYSEKRDLLVRELRADNDCVVAEIAFCCRYDREDFIGWIESAVPGVEIRWICIENNREKANRNCRNRPERAPEDHVRMNDAVSPRYDCPEGAKVVPMWPFDDSPV
jgi:hypothetical protein